ncbi:MAG: four helix bundle protein [Candidatus Omnitrophica bacterium]|nr:four helix bundle protein [Candidatus Omnitrophota bacterium]
MKILNFEESDVWQEARKLAKAVYLLGEKIANNRDYGLREQIQRAAVSCMANIAEGFDSDSDQQFIQFLGYAKRSASEVQSHLYVALDSDYINQEEFNSVYTLATNVRKLCSGFIKYLRKSI